MTRLLAALLLSVALLCGGAGDARALPVLPAVVAFFNSVVLATIATAVLNIAIGFGISYAASKLLPKPKAQKSVGGTQLDLRTDPETPRSLLVGRCVTAGILRHFETYQANKPGVFPNSNTDLIEIIELAGHKTTGLVSVFVEEKEVALTDTGGVRGFTVDGYNSKLAVRYFDGTQTAADAFTVTALGSHPERPWTAAMVGRSTSYMRVHSKYNQELVPSRLRWRFVVDGIPLYDPRLDTTAGGSGAHRFDDLDTHEFSANLFVILYNIYRGIRVKDSSGSPRHYYGLQATADQMPFDWWVAAMNACDEVVEGDPAYHGGAEIALDSEPRSVIRKILDASDGRVTEVGGIFYPFVGPPGLAVLSFDDGAILDRGETFNPILAQEQRVNYVTAQYTSPEDGWVPKAAPVRRNATWESEDGRRLPGHLDIPLVQDGDQAQRLMEQLLKRNRRQRRHQIALPPSAFGLIAGEVIAWGSEQHNYSAKLFEVEDVQVHFNLCITATLVEVDPDDFDPDITLVPEPTGSLVTDRPAPKIIDDFSAIGYLHQGDTGGERAAIRVFWTPPEDEDITGVAFQIRRPSQPLDVVDHAVEGDDAVLAGDTIILASLAGSTAYEVRARFKSFNGYATSWSLWIPVTTPAVSEVDLGAEVLAWLQQLDVTRDAALGPRLDELRAIVDGLAQDSSGMVALLDHFMQSSLVSYIGTANSNITEIRTVNAGFADLFINVFAGDDVRAANALLRMTAATLEEGVGASIDFQVRANVADEFAAAGLRIAVAATEDGAEGFVEVTGDKFYFHNTDTNERLPLHLVAIQDSPVLIEIPTSGALTGTVKADLALRRRKFRTLVTASAFVEWPDGVRDSDDWEIMFQFSGSGLTLTFNEERYLPPHPVLAPLNGDVVVLEFSAGRLFSSETLVATVGEKSGGQTIPPEENLWSWLQDIGATGSVEFVFDVATLLGYDSGIEPQKIIDLSGNGNDFFRGADASSATNDPTFNGAEGALTPSEYFSVDGGDYFTEAAAHTFANTWNTINSKFSLAFMVFIPSSFPSGSIIPLFSTLYSVTAGQHIISRGIDFMVERDAALAVGAGGQPTGLGARLRNHRSSNEGNGMAYDAKVAFSTDRLGKWNFVAIAYDETVGANGATFQVNATRTKVNSDMSGSPGNTPDAAVYRIGRKILKPFIESQMFARTGSRYAAMAGWSRRLSDDELDALYDKFKNTRLYPDLP